MDGDLAWSRGAKGNNQVLRRVTRVRKAAKYRGRRFSFLTTVFHGLTDIQVTYH